MNFDLDNISREPLRVIDENISMNEYVSISLNASNNDINFDVSSSIAWEKYIDEYLLRSNAQVAFGGYLERRNIYQRSTHFNSIDKKNQRNIHLGIDFWCKENTTVLAVLDGEIHSYKNNNNYGDYGPTIILKHDIANMVFYSLYGHLTLESIQNIKVGTKIRKSEIIGRLGNNKVNGDYAPHLHFQLILDIKDFVGDYPGVASENEIEYYAENCPNPNLLLKLPNEI